MSSCCIHGVGSNGGMHRRGSGGVAARTVPQPDGRRAGYIAGGDHGPWPVLRNGTVAVSSIDERYVSCVTLDLRCSGDATGEATHRTATECLPLAGSAVQCAYSQRHVRKPWLRGPGPPARGPISVREEQPSLPRMCSMCASAVRLEITSCSAISRLHRPCPTSSATSRSRWVRASHVPRWSRVGATRPGVSASASAKPTDSWTDSSASCRRSRSNGASPSS